MMLPVHISSFFFLCSFLVLYQVLSPSSFDCRLSNIGTFPSYRTHMAKKKDKAHLEKDTIKCLKMQLSSLFKRQEHVETLRRVSEVVSVMVTNIYSLLAYHVYTSYEDGMETVDGVRSFDASIVDKEVIHAAQLALQKRGSSSRRSQRKIELVERFNELRDHLFLPDDAVVVDVSRLHKILDDERTKISTAIINNIKGSFTR